MLEKENKTCTFRKMEEKLAVMLHMSRRIRYDRKKIKTGG